MILAVHGSSESTLDFQAKVKDPMAQKNGVGVEWGGWGNQLCTMIHWYHIIYNMTHKRTCTAVKTYRFKESCRGCPPSHNTHTKGLLLVSFASYHS